MPAQVETLLREAFKLNLYEAKVYLALLKGRMSPKKVSSVAAVPLPRVYDTLRSLGEKGFVEEADGVYVAVPPEVALEGRLSQFRSAFEAEQVARERTKRRLVEALKRSPKTEKGSEGGFTLLKGIHSITNKLLEILNEAEDIVLVAKKALEAKELFKPILETALKRRHKRVRLLVPSGTRISRDEKIAARALGVKVRTCDAIMMDMLVADSQSVMIGVPDPLSDEPYHSIGIYVRNPSFAKSIQKSVDELWAKSKPL